MRFFRRLLNTLVLAALALVLLTSFRPGFKQSGLRRVPASAATNPQIREHRGHSHNDFERSRPLGLALQNGFRSVEADIWLPGDQILVSHLGYWFDGSLEALYLDPLQELVTRLGSVYGDGRPFLLWLDIKERDKEIGPALQRVLSKYPMLTRFEGGRSVPGAVTAILSGVPWAKRSYVAHTERRFACRDDWSVHPNDPAATPALDSWCFYSLNWFNHFSWYGEGEMPEPERRKLEGLVRLAHSKNRQLRFWGAPDLSAVWEECSRAGVDLIGTDDPEGYRRFFAGAPEER